MPQSTVHTRASVDALRRLLSALPEDSKAARTLLTRVGLAALGRIRTAFVAKARGGTDEAGDSWRPLSPKTVAYSRRHRGRVKTSHLNKPSSALTTGQRQRWWEVYRKWVAIFHKRRGGGKGAAARIAWATLKREGATTILQKYGSAQVEILRDTGLLLKSLSPGTRSGEQVFRVGRGEVIVGTTRKGAKRHHEGDPSRGLPQRRLWPKTERWPQSWWDDILGEAKQCVLDLATQRVRGA